MPLKILIGIFFIALDRFLKFLAVNDFLNNKKIIGDFFKFNFASNYNIAFSLPLSGWWLNILIILIIIALIYNLLYLLLKQRYNQANLLLIIIFGAISNLFDRIKFGYVIDYFDLKYFTVFNLADVMIVGGVIGLGWLMIRDNKNNQY
ncbi:signal peptidase II [Candidatus Parcubacteria bacterium]|nr:signal peptidase II [Candidatus Parcubacteria bacterium]